jgi:hypothetical protein
MNPDRRVVTMSEWKSIETFTSEDPIWVIKYDMFQKDGSFVDKDTPGAEKFTSCHGYYTSEADAIKVRNHFPKPNGYRIEKVYKRVLK